MWSHLLAVLIVLVALVLYLYYSRQPCKEHMVSQAEFSLLSRGFNAPLAGDYANLSTIYRAEQADKTADYTLTMD